MLTAKPADAAPAPAPVAASQPGPVSQPGEDAASEVKPS
jgi:hypothetical protein